MKIIIDFFLNQSVLEFANYVLINSNLDSTGKMEKLKYITFQKELHINIT